MAEINFESVEYEKLDKFTKLAAFCIVIGKETSSKLIGKMDDNIAEEVCRKISEIEALDDEIRSLLMEEFSGIIGNSMQLTLGGTQYAHKMLELSRGESKANNMINKIAPVSSSNEIMDELGNMESRQIFNLLKNEHPQTIAYLLSHLTLSKASKVLKLMPSNIREEAVELVGSMEASSVEMLNKVVLALKKHINETDSSTVHASGGVAIVAGLLNNMDNDTSKNLLDKIEEKNATLGAAIRKKMFGFEDLVKLSLNDLQRVAREVDMQDLIIAMKSASTGLQEVLFKSVSKRAAETLKEELEMLGPMKLRDVEAAQDRIIKIVRTLEEKEEITRGGDSEMV